MFWTHFGSSVPPSLFETFHKCPSKVQYLKYKNKLNKVQKFTEPTNSHGNMRKYFCISRLMFFSQVSNLFKSNFFTVRYLILFMITSLKEERRKKQVS